MNIKTKGYLLGIIAAAAYGMNPLFALPLYEDGMNPDSVLFLRYLFAIPILYIMLKARGRGLKVYGKNILALMVFGFLMAISSLTLFQSYKFMDAGIASTLLFIYPILVALIMAFCFKERLSLQTIICVLLAVLGIGLLYKCSDGSTLSLKGTILVFLSSLSYAIYIVGVNKTRIKDMATLQVTFYVLVFGLLIFSSRLITGQDFVLPTKWYLWGNIFALAIFPTTISFVCTTSAIQYVGSTTTAILGALEPVTALFFGVTIFGESLTLRDVLGIILILSAVSMVIAGGSFSALLVRLKRMFPKVSKKR